MAPVRLAPDRSLKFPLKTGQRVKVDFMNIHKSGIGRENVQAKKVQIIIQEPGSPVVLT
jgi:hypothetical protein